MNRYLALLASALVLSACDEARDEYTYKLPNPPPTMAPPSGPTAAQAGQSGGPKPGEVASAGLPKALEVDFAAEQPPAAMAMRRVNVAGVSFNLPEFWEDTTSGRPMRLAEARIPSTDDEEGGEAELVVFHFGVGQGGTAEENISRWMRQFAPEAGTPPAEIAKGAVRGLNVTYVSTFGTYTAAAMGGGAPPPAAPGSGLIGLIVEGGPEGSLFIRATGPARTIVAAQPPMRWLAASLESSASISPVSSEVSSSSSGVSGGLSAPPVEMKIAGLQFSVPSDWTSTPPTSNMRAAQFIIPNVGEPSEAVVFHFGPGQGGSADDNIARWLKQVTKPDGSPSDAKPEKTVSGALTIQQVIADGTYAGAAMMGAPSKPMPNARLHGIVVEGGPEGSVFIRITGEQKAVAVREKEIRWFASFIRLPE